MVLLATNGDSCDLTTEELKAVDAAAQGIRLAARIVDTPCNEMNVDHFLRVRKFCSWHEC